VVTVHDCGCGHPPLGGFQLNQLLESAINQPSEHQIQKHVPGVEEYLALPFLQVLS
ncbi:hypothetical protein J6590_105561, partial [Homalodisca vitripennis]